MEGDGGEVDTGSAELQREEGRMPTIEKIGGAQLSVRQHTDSEYPSGVSVLRMALDCESVLGSFSAGSATDAKKGVCILTELEHLEENGAMQKESEYLVPPSGIIVHGHGGAEAIMRALHDISQKIGEISTRKVDTLENSTSRTLTSKHEFADLVLRLQNGDAQVVLRKIFLFTGDPCCNVMQEIWIEDPTNPDAQANILKSYAVVHVHHHSSVSHVRYVMQENLGHIDSINVRHLAQTGGKYQGDNPFFDTFIEPSGETLKIFPPDKFWKCSKCSMKIFQTRKSCFNAHCSGVRPCSMWKWNTKKTCESFNPKMHDEGLALILEQADNVFQWTSGSGKSMDRGAADSSDINSGSGYNLETLKLQYALTRKKNPASWAAISQSSAAAAAVQKAAVHDAVEQTSPGAGVTWAAEPHWADLPAPQIEEPPYRILFVGANNDNTSQLNLEGEMQEIETEFLLKKGSDSWRNNVIFQHSLCTSVSDLARGLNIHDPVILHFACHGDKSALQLFEKDLVAEDFVNFVSEWAASGKSLRLIIANACKSSYIAKSLSGIVDFVIGHHTPVGDADAVKFARVFYGYLGGGESLYLSFNAAKMISKPYCMTGRKNASQFRLVCPAKHYNELIIFLRSNGLQTIATEFSEAMGGMDLIEDLRSLNRDEIEDLQFLQRWQKEKIIRLATNSIAHAASLRDDSDTLSEASTLDADHRSEAGDSEDFDSSHTIVLAYQLENVGDIKLHLKSLFISFFMSDEIASDDGGNWTFCMLLWASFLRGATYESVHVTNMQEWLCEQLHCTRLCEKDMAEKVHSFRDDFMSHKLLVRIRQKMTMGPKRPDVASIAIIDQMVEHMLENEHVNLARWKEIVVGNWYLSQQQTPGDFFSRANDFLRKEVDCMQLLQFVETQSYVTFIRMPKLASLIFFEFLEVCKSENSSTAGASGGNTSFLSGFRFFWSNQHCFSLTSADLPPRHARPVVKEGLKRLACLSEQMWELLGPIRTIQDFISEVETDATAGTKAKKNTAEDAGEPMAVKTCQKILAKLMASKSAWPFQSIADLSMPEFKDYQKIVQNPMDLRTIHKKLEGGHYMQPLKEFPCDMMLVCRNAELVYDEDHEIYQHAMILGKTFDKLWSGMKESKEEMYSSGSRQNLGGLGERDKIWVDPVFGNQIRTYISRFKTHSVGSYVDSSNGELRNIDGESISLVLFPNKSFDEKCSEDDATQQELTCPISLQIMQDPVKCSDGKTYERLKIEIWFRDHGTSPFLTQTRLESEDGDKSKLKCEQNEEILAKIERFKLEKDKEEDERNQEAEGVAEQQILRQRFGFSFNDEILGQAGTGEGKQIESAETLLHFMMTNPEAYHACLTGPPASGKTVTMLQILYSAANLCDSMIERGESGVFIPLFMRAAELSTLLAGMSAVKLSALLLGNDRKAPLRHLVVLFLTDCSQKGLYSMEVVQTITKLFDMNQLLICVDGLDEAAEHRENLERSIDQAVLSAAQSRVLVSTREHSYTHSRACLRLGEFRVLKVQPLTKHRQMDMISRRIPVEDVEWFEQQLAETSQNNSELATSPFLLSLMIEVYKKHGALPTHRVDLYAKQVEGIVSRCVQNRIDSGEKYQVLSVGDIESSKEALELVTEFLETLSFICQMRLQKRDFKVANCVADMQNIWQRDLPLFTDISNLLFKEPVVGLLSRVGNDTYRFSHLTLQEYLAARCTVRLCGNNVEQLVQQLLPLESRWKREVLQFTACMLKEERLFIAFCKAVLQRDDGAGANCELVSAFLNESKAPDQVRLKVEIAVRERLLELRGTGNLIAGLCHPSPEMRELVLSEMGQFHIPSDPFSDGTVETLKATAIDKACAWYTRGAAIFSITQVAQMDYCDGRTATLEWILTILNEEAELLESIHFAVVTGLGTLLKGGSNNLDCLVLTQIDEDLILKTLARKECLALMHAISDLNIYSDGLVSWLLGNFTSHPITEGVWPSRHLLLMCDKIVVAKDFYRASRMGNLLLSRLHSLTFLPKSGSQTEGAICLDALAKIQKLIENEQSLDVQPFLETGTVQQRIGVLKAVMDLNIFFEIESFDNFGLEERGGLPLLEALLAMLPDSLLEWLLNNPRVVNDGVWPIEHIILISDRIVALNDHSRASLLSNLLWGRLHSLLFQDFEQKLLVDTLSKLQAFHKNQCQDVLQVLYSGTVQQRIRVLQAAAELNLPFGRQSLGPLVQCLLADPTVQRRNGPNAIDVEEDSTKSLLVYLLSMDERLHEEETRFEEKRITSLRPLHFLLEIILPEDFQSHMQLTEPLQNVVNRFTDSKTRQQRARFQTDALSEFPASSPDEVQHEASETMLDQLEVWKKRALQAEIERDQLKQLLFEFECSKRQEKENKREDSEEAAASVALAAHTRCPEKFESSLHSPRVTVLVDSIEKSHETLEVIFKNVEQSNVFAIDIEGDMNPGEQLSLIQIGLENQVVFIFDLLQCPDLLSVNSGLRTLLVGSATKILHDCRRDAEALKGQFNINLINVWDTQTSHAVLLSQDPNTFRQGLNVILQIYAGESNVHKREVNHKPGLWNKRPLPPLLQSYAGQDVQYLVQAYRKMREQIVARNLLAQACQASAAQLNHSFCFDPAATAGVLINPNNNANVAVNAADTENKITEAASPSRVLEGFDASKSGSISENHPALSVSASPSPVILPPARGSRTSMELLRERRQEEERKDREMPVAFTRSKDGHDEIKYREVKDRSDSPYHITDKTGKVLDDMEYLMVKTSTLKVLDVQILQIGLQKRIASEKCVLALLWERSGLIPNSLSQAALSEVLAEYGDNAVIRSNELYKGLCDLSEPWFQGHVLKDEKWAKEVCSALRLKIMGRFIFAIVLKYIREQFQRDVVRAEHDLKMLSTQIQRWTTDGAEEQMERQFLLKELRIGRRAVELPSWTGFVSSLHSSLGLNPNLLNLITLALKLANKGPEHVLAELVNEDAHQYPEAAIEQLQKCIGRHLTIFQKPPMDMLKTLLQLTSQEPAGSILFLSAEATCESQQLQIIEWVNKPSDLLLCVMEVRYHLGAVQVGTVSPDVKWIASGSGDKTVKVIEAATGKLHCTLTGHSQPVWSVCFAPDCNTIASGSRDNTIRLWSAETGASIKTLSGHTNWVSSVAFSLDGTTLASGSYDKTIKIWDFKTGELKQSISGHTSRVTSVGFSPDCKTIASGSWDNTVKIWDAETGEEKKSFTDHSDCVTAVCFSPNGKALASASDDKTIRLFHVETGRSKWASIVGGKEKSVCFAPDGNIVASSGRDNTVRLWSAETGDQIGSLSGHGGAVTHVEFASNGLTLVSSSTDGTTRVWDVTRVALTMEMPEISEFSNFALSMESSKEQVVDDFTITTKGDLVLVHKTDLSDGPLAAASKSKNKSKKTPVAFFRAPTVVNKLQRTGAQTLAAGCESGVLHLRATLLSPLRDL